MQIPEFTDFSQPTKAMTQTMAPQSIQDHPLICQHPILVPVGFQEKHRRNPASNCSRMAPIGFSPPIFLEQELPMHQRPSCQGWLVIAGPMTYWNILKYIEIYWSILKYIEIYWNILKYIEVYWNVLKYIYILHMYILEYIGIWCKCVMRPKLYYYKGSISQLMISIVILQGNMIIHPNKHDFHGSWSSSLFLDTAICHDWDLPRRNHCGHTTRSQKHMGSVVACWRNGNGEMLNIHTFFLVLFHGYVPQHHRLTSETDPKTNRCTAPRFRLAIQMGVKWSTQRSLLERQGLTTGRSVLIPRQIHALALEKNIYRNGWSTIFI